MPGIEIIGGKGDNADAVSAAPLLRPRSSTHPGYSIWRPSGRLRAVRALMSHLISLAGVKWSCLQFDKPAFPPLHKTTRPILSRSRTLITDAETGGQVTREVWEGDALKVGDVAVSVLATPCHTPGHITFVCDFGSGPRSLREFFIDNLLVRIHLLID